MEKTWFGLFLFCAVERTQFLNILYLKYFIVNFDSEFNHLNILNDLKF